MKKLYAILFLAVKISKMDINKGDMQKPQDQSAGMGFIGTNENEICQRELIADYIVKKLTNVSENLVCYINGCVNIRNKDKCLCDEHLIG
ncbi:MAG: hypothetical protein V7719_01970 [Psychroserpens sp.]|uniref:hypothetical protein n=1 Tax=Psychroserpens sp. TaxID=2020870 RepID=UPI003003521F